jgi:hypothetical protein
MPASMNFLRVFVLFSKLLLRYPRQIQILAAQFNLEIFLAARHVEVSIAHGIG